MAMSVKQRALAAACRTYFGIVALELVNAFVPSNDCHFHLAVVIGNFKYTVGDSLKVALALGFACQLSLFCRIVRSHSCDIFNHRVLTREGSVNRVIARSGRDQGSYRHSLTSWIHS